MLSPLNIPNLLVDEGARRLAMAHLDKAGVARARLRQGADQEALHDYRVALRRLRSAIRAYRKALRSTVTGKTERRLRRLARGTNRARDLEVHLDWLNQQRDRAPATEKPGVIWMIERLARERDEAADEMLDLDERLFPKLNVRLSDQLSRFRAAIDLTDGSRRQSTAAVTARRARRDAARLKERLGRIQGYSRGEAIHRARIAAKHLRYLLEPFAELVPEGTAAVDRLKALQDGFGDVHDAQVFASELEAALPKAEREAAAGHPLVPGLEALMAALQARGQHAYDQTARDWLGDAADQFFGSVDAVADAIAALADRDLEIERKFLLTGLPRLEHAEPPVEIEQGYLPGERLVERVRRIASEDGVELARTVKEGSGLTRLELEEPITAEVFDGLWPLTEGRRLRKRRYRVPEGDLTWEIDQFLDRDLVLAEVELAPGAPTDVEIPAWLRPHLDREVTGEDAYSNFKLASNG
ncbi:MAG TPA: CHAD domain-containing protein [Gemmatimonadales bacterium]|nr:CHAD domain-containing protein [Gemmatimonadales bacterium]